MITLSLASMLMLATATPEFPDGLDVSTVITEPCPTFSWSLDELNTAITLRVYRSDEVGRFDPEAPLITRDLDPGTQAWTASGSACLSRGEHYVWKVDDATAVVSDRSDSGYGHFQVAATPSAREFQEALRTIRAYTAQMTERDASARALNEEVAKAAIAIGMAVDGAGNVIGSSFAGDGSSLTNVTAVSLASAGTSCTSGQAPTGVDAQGNALDCQDMVTPAELIDHEAAADALYFRKTGGTISSSVTVNGSVNASGGFVGNATSAGRLAAVPSICPTGQVPRGILPNGNASSCVDVATQGELNAIKGCPADMVAIGGWCVDRLSRGTSGSVQSGTNAQITCGNAGKSLCPLSVMQMCDSLDTLKDGVNRTCGTLTDENPARIVTSTFCGNVNSGSSFNDFTAFVNDASASNQALCNSGAVAEFFCCLPRGR